MHNTETTNTAARSLLERAWKSTIASEAELLFNAAKRLDPTLDIEALKTLWVNQFLAKQANSRNVV